MPTKPGRKRCVLKDSKSYRLKDTPSYIAKDCPYKVKEGKNAKNGRPRVYQSLPKWQCSSKTNPACKFVWRWIGEPI